MRIAQLGEMDGPVLLFGGPYGNLQATRALLQAARALGIPPERCICTGDAAAYCADPGPVVSQLAETGAQAGTGIVTVAGNCERQLAARAGDCGCGFKGGTTCDLLSRGWYAHADATLDDAARAWMDSCPDAAVFTHAGRRYGVIHGGVRDISRFIWPDSPAGDFAVERAALETVTGPLDGIIAGHSGIAFQRRLGDLHWINAGVIGMPPHDGRPETRFAVLDQGEVVIHRLHYDAEGAAAAMRAAGLVQGYDNALLTGLWPSEDVLPESMRRKPAAQGASLASG